MQRVGPVLDPQCRPSSGWKAWATSPATTTSGCEVRSDGVRDDAVVDRETGLLGELGARSRTDADHDDVGGDHLVGERDDTRHRPAATPQRTDAGAEQETHPVAAVQGREMVAELVAERGPQDGRRRLDDGDVVAARAGGGSHLQPDPAAAHDHESARPAIEVRAQQIAVGQGAQVAHPVELPAGHRQRPRRRPGGEQQLRERHRLTVVECHRPGLQVDGGGGGTGTQVYVVLGVPAVLVHEHRVAPRAAGEIALGQRGPLVGPLGLFADQDDPAAEALGPQSLHRLGPGQPCADHHHRAAFHRRSSFGCAALLVLGSSVARRRSRRQRERPARPARAGRRSISPAVPSAGSWSTGGTPRRAGPGRALPPGGRGRARRRRSSRG